MLARIGVKVTLLAQPKAQYFAKVLKPGGYQTSFYLLGWTPGTLDSHNVLHDIMITGMGPMRGIPAVGIQPRLW